ncbi:MAG: terpene cyclase/mutase family protein [Thermoguttaceae bacterium]|nr:terpene cyclase/mutase family protein [Thermoguttaceae bacterium]MDW8037038.1 terpene cyclase/mutase family protein [Thermoguttaceae bacterium]
MKKALLVVSMMVAMEMGWGVVSSRLSMLGHSAEPTDPAQAYQQAVDRAVQYLRTKGQAEDGSFSKQAGIGVTAVVTAGLLSVGLSPEDPMVAKALKFLEGFRQPDGGIYQPDTFYKNYETSLALMVFQLANKDGRYDQLIKAANRFLKELQWDEGEGHDRTSMFYGGAGYGRSKRPDLSNTAFLIEALRATGTSPDDEAIKKALIFVSRCQNLESEHNTTPFPAKNPDGGFYYSPAAGGVSMAGTTPEGGLRSYGSMTYAGLKSMIYAGLTPEDKRVKAAVEWIQKHYDVKSNPGLGDAGLYYYYHTMAKALHVMGLKELTDAKGQKHDWRQELRQELLSRQKPDGSWVNQNPRWLEADPNLVTGYALLTLAYLKP